MSNVEVKKSVLLLIDLNTFVGAAPRSWSIAFYNIPFTPDDMIMRLMTYKAAGEEDGFYISTNLIDDQYLCSGYDPCAISSQQTFTIKKLVVGEYDFQLLNLDGTQNTTRTGKLFISLEFVKYKKSN